MSGLDLSEPKDYEIYCMYARELERLLESWKRRLGRIIRVV